MSAQMKCDQELLQYAFSFLDAAETALREEIGEVRRAEQRDAILVQEGRRVLSHAHGDAVRYEFRVPGPMRLRVGDRVRCVADGVPAVRATVVDQGSRRLTLDLETDLGPVVASATVFRDAAWLEEALRRRLSQLAERLRRDEDTGSFSHQSAFMVHRPADGYVPDGFVPLTVPDALGDRMASTLNEEQLRTVRTVLERPVTYVWGPPGTGKTTTVAAAVAALAYHGQRVLVVTPSNVAADVLLAQLHPWLEEHPLIGRGVVQRKGVNLTEHLTPEVRELCVPSTVLRRLQDEYDCVQTWLAEERADALQRGSGDAEVFDADLVANAAERRALAAELDRNCRVTVTPIANVYVRPELWRTYDAVIADESSMLALPALTLAAGLARARVVVAGDYQQLGAVTVADTPIVRAALRRDLFRVAGVAELLESECETPFAVALRDQYRMPRSVCTLVSDLYYGGQLRTAHARTPVAPLPLADVPLVLVDTSALEPTVRQGGRANPIHAEVVCAIVDMVKQSMPLGATTSVGVFSLYRDQVACLQRAQGAPGHCKADITATVHRAQGAEVAVAVVDLCDAPGAAVTFLRAARCSDEGGRLLNVALSRARESAIVVANVAYLERTGGAVVREILTRMKQIGAVVDAVDVVSASGYAIAHGR